VVVQVLDDEFLDVVLVLTGGGATATGATRGRSTRRALGHHHWPRDEPRRLPGWRQRSVDGALRLHASLPTLCRCRASGRGNETHRVNSRLTPRVSIMASSSAPRRVRASAAFGSEAEVLPAGSARPPQYSFSAPSADDPGQGRPAMWRQGEHIKAGHVELWVQRRGRGQRPAHRTRGDPRLGRRRSQGWPSADLRGPYLVRWDEGHGNHADDE
jgi:hypothetical protein